MKKFLTAQHRSDISVHAQAVLKSINIETTSGDYCNLSSPFRKIA